MLNVVAPIAFAWERIAERTSRLLGSGATGGGAGAGAGGADTWYTPVLAVLATALAAAAAASASVRWHRQGHRRRMAGSAPTASAQSKLSTCQPHGQPHGQPHDRAHDSSHDHAVANASGSDLLNRSTDDDPKATDPPLLRKHSEVKSYTTSRFTYPGIRTFYRRHPKADELPTKPAPIPLLVFIHGLGGSAAQFQPLLTTLIHVSSCLAIDLPGCGVSEFAPTDWGAYSTDALVELLETVIENYREQDAGQGVILIGHSMGSSFAAALASSTSPRPSKLLGNVLGLVSICPPSQPPFRRQVALFRTLLWIPTPVFDLWRAWDRRGGTESPSVRRFVGPGADLEARRLQCRFNNQSRSAVWRRVAWGSLPVYERNGQRRGGIPGQEVWEGLQLPVFLIAGASDHVTPPSEIEKIQRWLSGKESDVVPQKHNQQRRQQQEQPSGPTVADSAAPVDVTGAVPTPTTNTDCNQSSQSSQGRVEELTLTDADFRRLDATSQASFDDPSTPRDDAPEIPPLRCPPKKTVEAVVLPAPATHALLYTPATARVLAALVSDFLAGSVSGRLSLGWQLQFLSREGKWDVKNLAKWQSVAPVSAPIAGGVFRAMKTLREVDDAHCPSAFVSTWGHAVRDVVDISHDTPVYDPRGLEAAGVRYHKFPTVSKIPPTDEEADAFVVLVDKIRAEHPGRDEHQEMEASPVDDGPGPGGRQGQGSEVSIGVHCHYGFNRTGFFIVCYLVERCGFSTQAAIDEFARARPQGIRHQHFLDKLFIRYSTLKQTSRVVHGERDTTRPT